MSVKITRSPRAPSSNLEECVIYALTIYKENSKHSIPADIAAKLLGYSGANNGAAARALASLKAFGLLISNNKGEVAVSPDVETYMYAPDEQHKKDLLVRWLRSPRIYAELLDEYRDSLPVDQALRYKLIKMGFLPPSAEDCVKNLKASVQYADYYATQRNLVSDSDEGMLGVETDQQASINVSEKTTTTPLHFTTTPIATQTPSSASFSNAMSQVDRIPVRLSKGRKAWIEVPSPLYAADKEILKNQIDLIFADDDE